MADYYFFFSLKCFDLMSEASSGLEEMVGNADEILKKVELAICEELNTDLNVSSNHAYCVMTSVFLYIFYFILKLFLMYQMSLFTTKQHLFL